MRFPCGRSVGFHVVLEGTHYLHADVLDAPLKLDAGDMVVMGRGCDHLLTATPRVRGVPVESVDMVGSWETDGDEPVHIVSGAYQLWNTPVHPFFTELPTCFVLHAERGPRLDAIGLTVAMLAEESRTAGLGRETVVYGLLDVLFTHLVRAIVARQGGERAGWSQAVRDPQVRLVVAAMHADCARDWSLESLAAVGGMSRSVLAERFRGAMGETPLAYLRTVRLQRAMRLLGEGDGTLEQVASSVGYGDAFGFSKAFKRAVGVSPGEFRKRDVAEQREPWRLTAGEAVGAG